MNAPSPSSSSSSRVPTPNPRFTSSTSITENLLKPQPGGLVQLSDFRKRRAEALEQKDREAHHGGTFSRFHPAANGNAASSDGVSTALHSKKKRKPATKGKLSFALEDENEAKEEEGEEEETDNKIDPVVEPPQTKITEASPAQAASPSSEAHHGLEKKRLGPNSTVSITPKAMTKSAMLREAQARDQLRKEFLLMQEAVKATEILIPFVFYDGTNIPGGICKVKKGDFVWMMLDRSRKVGAKLGVGGGERSHSRREWARVGVDDLMLVRGEIIIPHHYELYYFIVNKTLGPTNVPLFDYASTPPSLSTSSSSSRPPPEGASADPNFTKVVDRRWYERNKHIFPASVWENFDPGRDYGKGKRSDAEGNAFFFS